MSKTNGAGGKRETSTPAATPPTAAPAPSSKPDKQARIQATQFKKGQSGNPGGKPKGTVSLWARIQRELLEASPEDRGKLADVAARAYVQQMVNGNWKLLQDFLDREEGKAVQRTELTGAGGETLRIVFPWELGTHGTNGDSPTDPPGAGNGSPVNGTLPSSRLRSAVGKNGS